MHGVIFKHLVSFYRVAKFAYGSDGHWFIWNSKFYCHLIRGSLRSYNCSGGLAEVYQVPSTSRYLHVLCQPDSLALWPAKEEEPKGSRLSTKKKVGIKQNPLQTKPPFICCLPSLSSPPCHSHWPCPFSQTMISPPPLLNCHSSPFFFHPILLVHRSALCPSSVPSSVTASYHSYSRS